MKRLLIIVLVVTITAGYSYLGEMDYNDWKSLNKESKIDFIYELISIFATEQSCSEVSFYASRKKDILYFYARCSEKDVEI